MKGETMNIQQAIKEVSDGATTIWKQYAPGYYAYVSVSPGDGDTSGDVYHAAFCKGMEPPHATERHATADEVVAYLTEQGWDEGWEITEDEE